MSEPWQSDRGFSSSQEQTMTHDPLGRDAPTHPEDRRTFLRWVTHGLGFMFAVVLGAPVIMYLLDPRNRQAMASEFRDVAKISELPLNQPREFIIRETQRDAWTLQPDVIVGRVVMIRRGAPTPQNPNVDAYNTICPHMGCAVNYTGTPQGVSFLCPCHGGRFNFEGQRIEPQHNVAPRDMDSLRVRWKPGSEQIVQLEYKNFHSNRPEKDEVN